MHQETELKRRLYRTLLAIFIILAGIFIGFRFFATGIGSFFGIISKIGKPKVKDDTLAPVPPYFNNVPLVTNKKLITLKGFAEPGSTVKIFVNGPEAASVVTDTSGVFSADNIALLDGKNTIFAKAEDVYQNQSENSKTIETVYDGKKPKITVTEPKEGSTVRNLNQRILVKGSTDEKSEVRINDRLAISNPDNTFEILLGVEVGEVEIKIEATDEAGNKEDKKLKVTYVRAGI
ncbi:MAG: hypothetical protein UW65_C0019G0012 [candidate division WWE3 bacterium GW2011_GWB1_44_4]|uniref:Uncharacterized protein n=3 Tax=Katanobacteria TaxID=422282 RepID=A0A0G1HE16_UNCKA|nr:MAG: hypothetical protein UW36_C0003G0028 [candidate division WWE3 bacterium GW2011_GWA2_44_16]KKT69585.1 MAG: hypothetical protein UW65_C0019G0012 [candidate division WWE3 bacterium GW2011_GWB1_44_4]OGC52335.1 MAG: hypothetical protein A2709_03300 [candidate division WWE3 bacterium RIFCSPHIGHO2_01_FULL_43_9]